MLLSCPFDTSERGFQSGGWLKVTDEVLDPESSLCLCDAKA